MQLRQWALAPVLAGCALVAMTSCTDEPQTEAGLGPTITLSAAVSAYDVVRVPSIAIDGNLNDWMNIAEISMADNSGRAAGLDNTAKVKLAWDATYLYAAYNVTDTELLAVQTTRDHGDIYKDDAVELYIDPQGDGGSATRMTATDYQLMVNLRETLGDLRGNGAGGKDASYNAASFTAKVAVNGTLNASGSDVGYIVELRIAWGDLGVTPAAGHTMRLDLAVDDNDTGNTRTEEFDWAGLTTFNNPSAWNEVQLVDPVPVSAYDIVRVAGMTVDGNLSDWAGITTISMADNSGRGGGVDNTAKVRLAWDPTYLYYAYDVTDTELLALQTTRDHSDIYKDDEVELYLDPERDSWNRSKMTATDYQFLANVREALGDVKGNASGGKDASFNAASFLAKAVTNGTLNATGADVGYAIEGRIGWTDLGITPAAGGFMRLDAAVGDRDGDGSPTEEFDWAGLSVFNNPAAWKDVKLVVDAAAPAAPTNLVLTVVSSSRIDVAWTASSSGDVARYRIYRATSGTPTLHQTVAGSPYQDTALTAGTTYTYQVSAVDAAGNESQKTPIATATTQGAPSTFRFPVGMFKGTQLDLMGMPHVPDGHFTHSSVSGVIQTLDAARAAGARITLRVTGGQQNFADPATPRTFVLSKWKTRFDRVNTANVQGYLADGTLIGHYAIDEPFSDFDNFSGSFAEQMCAYQDSFPGWRDVPCMIRDKNTKLFDHAPPGGYQHLDAGWAQLADHHYDHEYNWNMRAYFEDNLNKGRQVGLGLMYGFNLLNGGREFPGCDQPDSQENCAMTAAEIRAMADSLAVIGHDQGCGVFGWEITRDPGPRRDYFFRSDIQSALQYLKSRVGGLRPGPCDLGG